MKLRLAHKGLILVALILAVELLFLGTLFFLLVQTEQAALRANHAKKIAGLTNHIWQTISSGAATVNYVFSHLEDKAHMREFLQTVPPTFAEMERLNDLMKNDDEASVGKLRVALATGRKGLKALSLILRLLEQDDVAGAYALDNEMTKRGMRLSQIHIRLTDQIHDARQQQLAIMKESPLIAARSRDMIQAVMIGGVIANVAVAVLLLLVFVRGITSRLQLVLDNTRLLTNGKPLKPALPNSDEIGYLDRVFHDMADTLAETRRKEHAIIENSSDVICSLNNDLRFISVSPASAFIWQYTPTELADRPLSSLVEDDHLASYKRAFEEATKSGSNSFESKLRRKDQVSADMLWSIRWNSEQKIYFCVAHDITERVRQETLLRSSEARVRAMFNNVRVGLMTVRRDGHIESANAATESMLKYNTSELADFPVARIFSKTAIKAAKQSGVHRSVEESDDTTVLLDAQKSDDGADDFVRDLLIRAQSRILELEAVTKDGRTLPVEFSAKRFAAFEEEKILTNLIDISERYELDRMKQEFVAMISHDLRTPLNSVQGYLELLGEGLYGQLPEDAQYEAKQAEANVVALLRLVNDLLDIAKIDSGKLELNIKPINLSELFEKCCEVVRQYATDRFIDVQFTSNCSARVDADEHRIERVLISLLTYAIKSSQPQGKITVAAEEQGRFVKVSVTDSAPVMEARQAEQIFDRFRRDKGNDSDISLAICKAIVTEHGGTIGVEPAPPGNVFWFKLAKCSSPSVRQN